MEKSKRAIISLLCGLIVLTQTTRLFNDTAIYDVPVPQPVAQQSKRTFTADVSAYTASVEECNNSNGITASGEVAVDGFVAADDLPFDTIIEIDGKQYTVKDRFGGGYRNRIDIFMSGSRADAFRFGRQIKEVTIIKMGDE